MALYGLQSCQNYKFVKIEGDLVRIYCSIPLTQRLSNLTGVSANFVSLPLFSADSAQFAGADFEFYRRYMDRKQNQQNRGVSFIFLQENSPYSISNSDDVVTVDSCRQYGDYTAIGSSVTMLRQLTAVTTPSPSGHYVVTVPSRWLME